jgi:hypothetical protein
VLKQHANNNIAKGVRYMASTAVEQITREAETLPLTDYIDLIERLVHRLRDKGDTPPVQHNWQELYGLGKGLWDDEDAQDYVNRLREDRL